MTNQSNITPSLKIVAWGFILIGIFSIFEILFSFTVNRISFNFGILGIFIGRGILNRKHFWRSFASVFTFIAIPFCVFLFLISIGDIGSGHLTFFGNKFQGLSSNMAFLFTVPPLFFFVWQMKVLNSKRTSEFFGKNKSSMSPEKLEEYMNQKRDS